MENSYFGIENKKDPKQIDKWCAKLFWRNTDTENKGLASAEFKEEAFTIYKFLDEECKNKEVWKEIHQMRISEHSTTQFSRQRDYVGVVIWDFG